MKILQNEFVRYALILVVGVSIGAIFYPSKTITREETLKYDQQITKLQTEKEVTKKFYETKLSSELKVNRELQSESTSKVNELRKENFKLKQKVSEKKFKIVRPDGTVEEKWFKESETEVVASVVSEIKQEFNTKVKSIESKWKRIHESRVAKIKKDFEKKLSEKSTVKIEHTKKEKIEINKRKFGIAGGVMNDNKFYTNISYDIFGPIFLNLQFETDKEIDGKSAGIGIGMRF